MATGDVPVVYMPGHEMPTFIALPCPYHPIDPTLIFKSKLEIRLDNPIECESTHLANPL